ncbi:hypothetical protein [Salibacterium sp. K-3]
MKLDVKFHQEKIGEIEESQLLPFLHHCRDAGFETRWNLEEKSIDIQGGLSGGHLSVVREEENRPYEQDLRRQLKKWSASTGLTVHETDRETLGQNDHLHLFPFSTEFSEDTNEPHVTIFYYLPNEMKDIKARIEKQNSPLPFHVTWKREKQRLPAPLLRIVCHLPEDNSQTQWQTFSSSLSIFLVMGISRYFMERKRVTATSLSDVHLGGFFRKEPAPPEKKKTPAPAEKKAAPAPSKQQAQADVFFDYTVHTSKESSSFLVTGELIIKNAGDTPLDQPRFCLKTNPVAGVQIGGQILPPQQTEVLGVQSEAGTKGWQFMEENWLETAEERGEYWIRPIDRVRIPPAGSLALPKLQLIMDHPADSDTTVIQAAAYFENHNQSFPSSNAIRLSFADKA